MIEHTYPDNSDMTNTTVNFRNIDSKTLVCCDSKGKLSIYDLRVSNHTLSYNVGVHKGLITTLDYSKDEQNLYLGTLGGYILNYDFRLNSIIESFKYNDNTPIRGLSTFLTGRDNLCSSLSPMSKYLLIYTAADNSDMGLWNLNTMNCDMLFKTNQLQGKEFKPLGTEIPIILKEEKKDFFIESIYKNIKDLSHIENISADFYTFSNKRIGKIHNYFENLHSVYCPIRLSGDNYPFFISGGCDSTIRYWDITKDCQERSFLVNCPNKTYDCKFTTLPVDGCNTTILQSNEILNSGIPKKDTNSFSEYQHYNGISFHLVTHNEFEENLEILKYCTKISDAAHRSIVTDITSLSVNGIQLLVSSSWDGTIKLWK
jgi:WD40 repeat protein